MSWTFEGPALAGAKRDQIGGKAYGLARLLEWGLPVPACFVVPVAAFVRCLGDAGIDPGKGAGIEGARLPLAVAQAVDAALRRLDVPSGRYAVRSSATAEDLEDLSFAGIYHSSINVGADEVHAAILRCYASLYSPRCLAYLDRCGRSPGEIGMAVVIQGLVDATVAGTCFTADPDTGLEDLARIDAAWGFGEGVVSGKLIPHSYTVHKHKRIVLRRELGDARGFFPSADGGVSLSELPEPYAHRSCLGQRELDELLELAAKVEARAGRPMDIEWAIDGTARLHLLQARPLTVSPPTELTTCTVTIEAGASPLVSGFPITREAITGRIAHYRRDELADGDIVVSADLEPDLLPALGRAAGVVIEHGGPTSHMAILLRELRMPALIGAAGACERLRSGEVVTLECGGVQGQVWPGALPIQRQSVAIDALPRTRTRVHVVTSAREQLQIYRRLPLAGIGLVRLERVIQERVGVHPQALIDYDRGERGDAELARTIAALIRGYGTAAEFYIQRMSEAISDFAASWPEGVVNVRVPDLGSDNHLGLIGAPPEVHGASPMLGWRGTSLLIAEDYAPAFDLDCEVLRRVVEVNGFTNVQVLVPFCRTPTDGATICRRIRERTSPKLQVGMMVEIPANAVLGRAFAEIFDFFLVGPMDLTQLVYGADRLSTRTADYCQETEAVKELVKVFLERIAHAGKDVYIGGWPLYQHAAEYHQLKTNNRIHLVELPDRILELFDRVATLERNHGEELFT